MSEIKHYLKDVPIVLAGTKADLRDDKGFLAAKKLTAVSSEAAEAVAKDIGARYYVECSSKTGQGVKTVFDDAIKAVLTKKKVKKGGCTML